MTAPYYQDDHVTLHHGDCLDIMRTMPDNSIDSIVTDPPYGLGFMGKAWDDLPPGPPWAQECLRVLKPGGHLLAFGGSRTWHRLAVAVEDAGFEIRDSLAWLYGSGFPKSLDVSKAIDKAAGAEREVVGDKLSRPGCHLHGHDGGEAFSHGLSSSTPETRLASATITAPSTPEAVKWQGFGTALKPAFEPVVVGRKPFTGTVAGNVLAHGTGALNIDSCRIGADTCRGDRYNGNPAGGTSDMMLSKPRLETWVVKPGRWPANVLLDEAQAAALDRQSGTSTSTKGKPRGAAKGEGWGMTQTGAEYTDTGGASRFFFTGKGDTIETCETANTAPPSSSPPSTPAASAPNDAVTSEAHEAAFSPLHSAAPSTNATATESKPKSARNTQQTPSTEPKSSPESKQQKRTPTRNPASNAEQAEQTGTTTTTPSRSISDGSAGAATSSTTPNSAAHGGPASPLETLDARFIYCAKAPKSERPNVDGVQHPTVKPLAVMRWLLRLVTPPGGVTLDTFAGSGATVEAALQEGLRPIAIEREAEYLPLILHRVERHRAQPAPLNFGESE